MLDLAVAEDNARFVSVGGDKTVFLWDVQTANTLRRFNGHAGKVECCAFAGEDDSVVVSGKSFFYLLLSADTCHAQITVVIQSWR